MLTEWPENEESLHEILNKEFYESYDADYFRDKAIILGALLAKPGQFLEIIKAGYEIGKIKVGEIKDSNTEQLKIEKYAKQELVINQYHSTETLFRLLFASVEHRKCPWIGLTELSNFYEFKKRVQQISEGKYFEGDFAENLAGVFLGGRTAFDKLTDVEWERNKRFLADIIAHLAHELLKTPDYNAFKHGQAVFDTQFGFSLSDELGAEKQDTFVYLYGKVEKEKGFETHKLMRNLKFMKWEVRYALTYLTSQLISNLIGVDAVRLKAKESVRLESFHTMELDKILEYGIHFDEMGQQLRELRYKIPKSKSSKKKRK